MRGFAALTAMAGLAGAALAYATGRRGRAAHPVPAPDVPAPAPAPAPEDAEAAIDAARERLRARAEGLRGDAGTGADGPPGT